MVCGTVLYCTVLYCTILYCTVLYCTVLYCTVLYRIVLYVLYCTVRFEAATICDLLVANTCKENARKTFEQNAIQHDNDTMELVIYGARQFRIKTRRSRHFGNLSYGGLHEELVRPT